MGQIATKLIVVAFGIAMIMIIALTVSIALLFTIGKSAIKNDNNDGSNIGNLVPCQCGCPAIDPQVTPRIVNGETAVPNSWPWQLLLIAFTREGLPSSYCGASLISPRHVLTAAHCVFGYSPRYIGFFPGLHVFNISQLVPSLAMFSQRIFVHETYDDYTLNDDVALIRLRSDLVIDEKVSLVCMAPANDGEKGLTEGEPFVATGWGALNSFNRSRPERLQQVRVQYVPQSSTLCSALVGSGTNMRPGQMCAGYPPKAVCFGDSGGPLVRSITHSNGKTYWQQVGIMSGTVDCGYNTTVPDIYARVSYYNKWIVDKMLQSP